MEYASWLCERPVSPTMPADGESSAQAGLAVAAALPSGMGGEAPNASDSTRWAFHGQSGEDFTEASRASGSAA
jgi:hypothetical protein